MSIERVLKEKTNLPSIVVNQKLRVIEDTEIINFSEVVEINNNILDKAYPTDATAGVIYIDAPNWEVGYTVMYKYVTSYLKESVDFDLHNGLPRVLDYQWDLLKVGLDASKFETLTEVELLVLTISEIDKNLYSLVRARALHCRPTIILDICDSKTSNEVKLISYQTNTYIDLKIDSNEK